MTKKKCERLTKSEALALSWKSRADYRGHDRSKGLYNDLTSDIVRDETEKGCVYCGDKNRVGLDRIDNSVGHCKDNVVPCCYSCNCARNDNFSFEEMQIIGLVIKAVKRSRDESSRIACAALFDKVDKALNKGDDVWWVVEGLPTKGGAK